MRGQTLETLLTRLREETGLSTNLRHNYQARDGQVALLRRMQEWIYDAADWEHMKRKWRIAVEAGLSQYAIPDQMNWDRVIKAVRVDEGGETPLVPEIGTFEVNFPVREDGVEGRSDKTQSYEISNGVITIWPTPRTTSGFIDIYAFKRLDPLLSDNSRAEMDDQLIYLFAAAETLTAAGDKSAQAKLEAANTRMAQLTKQVERIKVFTAGNGLPQPSYGNRLNSGRRPWR